MAKRFPGLIIWSMLNKMGIHLNHFKDLEDLMNITWDANPARICIVGEGVSKNYNKQAMRFSPALTHYVI